MKRISSFLLVAATAILPAACGGTVSTDDGQPADQTTDGVTDDGTTTQDEWDVLLSQRTYDYNTALRTAALRLTGDLPTLVEINAVNSAADDGAKKVAYETLIRDYMNRPAFARQMMLFWQDTFKMGDSAVFDTAPAFAADLAVNNLPYTDLFTRATNNCPTFDKATNTFAPGECTNGGTQVGVLTNPGMMVQYFGNFAFRRVKWVNETFDCLKFPVEIGGPEQEIGASTPYTGLWPLSSIAGTSNGGRVNFQDTSSVLCVNCHQTINHFVSFFAHYDGTGKYTAALSVPTPMGNDTLALDSDYLPPGEGFAWRFGKPVSDMASLGTTMAADPAVTTCGVARMWNWALGKTDIVDTLMDVPAETISTQVAAFTANNYKMKDLIYSVFTADDFVKF